MQLILRFLENVEADIGIGDRVEGNGASYPGIRQHTTPQLSVNGELLMSDVRIYNNPDARIL
jgi:hypothetical protein